MKKLLKYLLLMTIYMVLVQTTPVFAKENIIASGYTLPYDKYDDGSSGTEYRPGTVYSKFGVYTKIYYQVTLSSSAQIKYSGNRAYRCAWYLVYLEDENGNSVCIDKTHGNPNGYSVGLSPDYPANSMAPGEVVTKEVTVPSGWNNKKVRVKYMAAISTGGPITLKYLQADTHTSHTWNSGSVTKAATHTSTGVKTYTCTVCGATKTETIPMVAHSYSLTAVIFPLLHAFKPQYLVVFTNFPLCRLIRQNHYILCCQRFSASLRVKDLFGYQSTFFLAYVIM